MSTSDISAQETLDINFSIEGDGLESQSHASTPRLAQGSQQDTSPQEHPGEDHEEVEEVEEASPQEPMQAAPQHMGEMAYREDSSSEESVSAQSSPERQRRQEQRQEEVREHEVSAGSVEEQQHGAMPVMNPADMPFAASGAIRPPLPEIYTTAAPQDGGEPSSGSGSRRVSGSVSPDHVSPRIKIRRKSLITPFQLLIRSGLNKNIPALVMIYDSDPDAAATHSPRRASSAELPTVEKGAAAPIVLTPNRRPTSPSAVSSGSDIEDFISALPFFGSPLELLIRSAGRRPVPTLVRLADHSKYEKKRNAEIDKKGYCSSDESMLDTESEPDEMDLVREYGPLNLVTTVADERGTPANALKFIVAHHAKQEKEDKARREREAADARRWGVQSSMTVEPAAPEPKVDANGKTRRRRKRVATPPPPTSLSVADPVRMLFDICGERGVEAPAMGMFYAEKEQQQLKEWEEECEKKREKDIRRRNRRRVRRERYQRGPRGLQVMLDAAVSAGTITDMPHFALVAGYAKDLELPSDYDEELDKPKPIPYFGTPLELIMESAEDMGRPLAALRMIEEGEPLYHQQIAEDTAACAASRAPALQLMSRYAELWDKSIPMLGFIAEHAETAKEFEERLAIKEEEERLRKEYTEDEHTSFWDNNHALFASSSDQILSAIQQEEIEGWAEICAAEPPARKDAEERWRNRVLEEQRLERLAIENEETAARVPSFKDDEYADRREIEKAEDESYKNVILIQVARHEREVMCGEEAGDRQAIVDEEGDVRALVFQEYQAEGRDAKEREELRLAREAKERAERLAVEEKEEELRAEIPPIETRERFGIRHQSLDDFRHMSIRMHRRLWDERLDQRRMEEEEIDSRRPILTTEGKEWWWMVHNASESHLAVREIEFWRAHDEECLQQIQTIEKEEDERREGTVSADWLDGIVHMKEKEEDERAKAEAATRDRVAAEEEAERQRQEALLAEQEDRMLKIQASREKGRTKKELSRLQSRQPSQRVSRLETPNPRSSGGTSRTTPITPHPPDALLTIPEEQSVHSGSDHEDDEGYSTDDTGGASLSSLSTVASKKGSPTKDDEAPAPPPPDPGHIYGVPMTLKPEPGDWALTPAVPPRGQVRVGKQDDEGADEMNSPLPHHRKQPEDDEDEYAASPARAHAVKLRDRVAESDRPNQKSLVKPKKAYRSYGAGAIVMGPIRGRIQQQEMKGYKSQLEASAKQNRQDHEMAKLAMLAVLEKEEAERQANRIRRPSERLTAPRKSTVQPPTEEETSETATPRSRKSSQAPRRRSTKTKKEDKEDAQEVEEEAAAEEQSPKKEEAEKTPKPKRSRPKAKRTPSTTSKKKKEDGEGSLSRGDSAQYLRRRLSLSQAKTAEEHDRSFRTAIELILLLKSQVKTSHQSGVFTDEELARVDADETKIAKAKRRAAGDLEAAHMPPKHQKYRDEQGSLELEGFLEELTYDTDIKAGNLALFKALVRCADIDVPELCESRGLLSTALADGSRGYTEALLSADPAVRFDPMEALASAFFNQQCRIPLTLQLLEANHPAFNWSELDPDELRPMWSEFFEDICSKKRAIPREKRDGRIELIKLMASNSSVPLDATNEGADGQTVFSRAAHEGDVELLKLLGELNLVPDINRVQSDNTTALIQSVFSNDVATVKHILTLPGIELNHETEDGTALTLAKFLSRDAQIIDALVKAGAKEGSASPMMQRAPTFAVPARKAPQSPRHSRPGTPSLANTARNAATNNALADGGHFTMLAAVLEVVGEQIEAHEARNAADAEAQRVERQKAREARRQRRREEKERKKAVAASSEQTTGDDASKKADGNYSDSFESESDSGKNKTEDAKGEYSDSFENDSDDESKKRDAPKPAPAKDGGEYSDSFEDDDDDNSDAKKEETPPASTQPPQQPSSSPSESSEEDEEEDVVLPPVADPTPLLRELLTLARVEELTKSLTQPAPRSGPAEEVEGDEEKYESASSVEGADDTDEEEEEAEEPPTPAAKRKEVDPESSARPPTAPHQPRGRKQPASPRKPPPKAAPKPPVGAKPKSSGRTEQRKRSTSNRKRSASAKKKTRPSTAAQLPSARLLGDTLKPQSERPASGSHLPKHIGKPPPKLRSQADLDKFVERFHAHPVKTHEVNRDSREKQYWASYQKHNDEARREYIAKNEANNRDSAAEDEELTPLERQERTVDRLAVKSVQMREHHKKELEEKYTPRPPKQPPAAVAPEDLAARMYDEPVRQHDRKLQELRESALREQDQRNLHAGKVVSEDRWHAIIERNFNEPFPPKKH